MLWFKRKEKAELDLAVRGVGKSATALRIGEKLPSDHVFGATETHFGGNPYFESGEIWPTFGDEKRPYDFVCQINLNECPDRPDVPFDLITIFICWSKINDGDWTLLDHEDIKRICLVRSYQNASPDKAVTIPRPAQLDAGDYKVHPCSIRTEPFMTYPQSPEGFHDVEAASSKFRDAYSAYVSSLKRIGFWRHEMQSRIGGFPAWVCDCEFVDDSMIFLGQIDYEPKANNSILDAAPIYIAVSASDPTKIETEIFQTY